MTHIPLITQFNGQVPDKATMDKDTFANSVHSYLNYFNNVFVPQSQTFANKLQVFGGEIIQLKNDAENLVVQADSIKQEANEIKNDVLTYKNTALTYMNLAKNYANADKDVEIETGFYSAKHYMLKTQEIMDSAVAKLPEGTIDDAVIADDKTWSSSKIDDAIKKIATASSVIDGGDATTDPDVKIDGGGAD